STKPKILIVGILFEIPDSGGRVWAPGYNAATLGGIILIEGVDLECGLGDAHCLCSFLPCLTRFFDLGLHLFDLIFSLMDLFLNFSHGWLCLGICEVRIW